MAAKDKKQPKLSKKRKPVKSWSMYPTRHDNVCDLLREDNLVFDFNVNDDDFGLTNEWDSCIMGRFVCRNSNCPAHADAWTSKQIAITIRGYSGNRYNARVYHQGCERCKTPMKPKLDHSYAERVSHRLKIWSGVPVEPRPFSGRSDGPHRSDLCEGCKHGRCSKMGRPSRMNSH